MAPQAPQARSVTDSHQLTTVVWRRTKRVLMVTRMAIIIESHYVQ